MYKQSYRPDHEFIYYFNLRRAQAANLVCHQSSSDAIILYDNMPADARDQVVTLQVKSCSKGKPEATPGDRIDLRISGQPEEP